MSTDVNVEHVAPLQNAPRHPQPTESLRKRKKPHSSPISLLFGAFEIKCPNRPAVTVEPLRTVAKSQIPLHLFDFADTNDALAQRRLFQAVNPELDAYLDNSATDQPHILLVQVNHTSRLAAVEHVDANLYSITPFIPGIDITSVLPQPLTGAVRPRKIQKLTVGTETREEWWRSAQLITRSPERRAAARTATLAREVQQEKARSPSTPTTATEANGHPESPDEPQVAPRDASLLSVDEIARSLAEQYLEALYLSKASLAYFAKSTLPRARAAVGPGETESSRKLQLVGSLRLMILSPSTFDKKYRQTIPEAIKDLTSGSDAAHTNGNARMQKTKKLKKPKPGKNGMYSSEVQMMIRWWHGQDVTAEAASNQNHSKAMQVDLRLRETLLQIILVLEVIALEASMAKSADTQASSLPEAPHENSQQASQPLYRKSKKPQNLDAALEMLVDRLCIWQSIEAVDHEEKAKEINARSAYNPSTCDPPASKDKFQDFCQHVLIPFYAPRLRLKVEEIAKRMGVSSQSSPTRPLPGKGGEKIAPGTEIRRIPPQARERRLQRISSASGVQQKPPSLVRSATDSVLRAKTRESSSTPFDEPMKPPRRTLSRASSISSSTKLSQREVDMTAISRFSQSRVKRKPSVDTELQEAIATLKKPNRGKAVQEYANSLETKKVQIPKKPWLKSRLGVEVGATPRREQKTKDAMTAAGCILDTAVPDSDFPIPSTDPHAAATPRRVSEIGDSTSKPNVAARLPPSDQADVFQTPSHRLSKRKQPALLVGTRDPDHDMVPASTQKPTNVKVSTSTPVKAVRRTEELVLQSSPPQVGESDERRDSERQVSPERQSSRPPESDTRAGATPGASLYASLGWDDDDCDELL